LAAHDGDGKQQLPTDEERHRDEVEPANAFPQRVHGAPR
jgi:hypothetical protein